VKGISFRAALLSPIIDFHTHCAPRPTGDRFGVAEAMHATPVGRNMVTNYRGLPAVAYHEMTDFDLQQEISARAGVTHRILITSGCCTSTPWAFGRRTCAKPRCSEPTA
jgi:hypothetical protein